MSLRELFSQKRDKDLITIPLSPSEMYRCEKAIEKFDIPYLGKNADLYQIAKELNLDVEETEDLPDGKIACLAPPDIGSSKYGKILLKGSNKDNGRFAHELVHYYIDVGIGNTVKATYYRDEDFSINDGPITEQRAEYIAITCSFPLSYRQLSEKLLKADEEGSGLSGRMQLVNALSEEYSISSADVLRRVVEVRDIDRYRISKRETPSTSFYVES